MKKHLTKRVLSLLLVLAMLMGFSVPAGAVQSQSDLQSLSFEQTTGFSAVRDVALTEEAQSVTNEPQYAPEDVVRVSIVLSGKSTLEKGFSTRNIAANAQAMAYRESLQTTQSQVTARIEKATGEELDVHWNLTLAANIISADVPYGQIETIRDVAGVADVVLETRYDPCVVKEEETIDPNMATSSAQIGSALAWADGYTGAGSRIAVIDTGLDLDHQSFDASAYEYSMSLLAAEQDMTLEEYMEEMNVLTTEEIAEVLPLLNVRGQYYSPKAEAEDLYRNSKVPFGYNYIDMDAGYIEHDFDQQGGHGSHVEGIAAANAYVPNGDGTFSKALEAARVQGVAPDAQIIVMKVFGKMGGAYDSDYMAGIEDAILLNCDSINLSLGSANPGFVTNKTYQELLDSLVESDTVVAMSAGNSGHWADSALHNAPGYLYADDASTWTGGSPGSYTNSLGVASVDNAGGFGYYFTVGDVGVLYTETDYSNAPLSTLGGEQEYIFIDGIGTIEDFLALGDALEGKVAFCFRGSSSFFEKATNAVDCGAIATVVCNNQPGSINMDLTDYRYTEPCVSITQAEANAVRAASTPVTDAAGNVLYYTGKMLIGSEQGAIVSSAEYYTISSFSSYGVPGDLSLKPEITAPGGSIYSVDGEVKGGKAYVNMSGTSMASPQVAGMAALVAQRIKAEGLEEKTGLTVRALSQSLLMSTAVPMLESEGQYYPVMRQGAGLANVGAAVQADSYILMDASATDSWADGKVKVELGEDAKRTGVYEITFTLNNLTDKAQQYILSADLFTQGLASDGTYLYMDNSTVNLQAIATWTVDGQAVEPPAEMPMYDFNGDNLINIDDVQTLLDHVVDNEIKLYNADLADLSGDGEITTYDAYLLLGQMNAGLVELPANGAVEITVELALTDDEKEYLENDPNGAYIEGYIFVEGLSSEEGIKGTSHSIPVLGYYGSWTEPSMYDRGTFISRLYGDTEPTYISGKAQNYLSLKRADNAENYNHTGNPYMVEETYPEGKIALNPDAVINQIHFATIRNAGAYFNVAQDEDGKVRYITTPGADLAGAYYYVNGATWQNTGYYINFARTPAYMGFSEGETMTFSFVTLPEYYSKGGLTTDKLVTMIENGEIGEGAFLSSTFKLDATAPEIGNIYRDLKSDNILVEATDDNHVAIVQVQTLGGRVLAQSLPNEDGMTTIDLSGVQVGTEAVIVVGDYAMNESAYVVDLGGKPVDYSGEFYGFTPTNNRGTGNRWMQIIPEDLWYYDNSAYDGTINIQSASLTITAAEYVDGYVFMAASDGYIYVAQHDMWQDTHRGTYYKEHATAINDMAFSYADKTMYLMDDSNNLWAMDVLTCEMTKVGNITVTNPVTGSASSQKKIIGLTIDDNGNFYIVNWGGPTQAFLYTFTLDDFVDGKITDLAPMVNTKSGVIDYQFCTGSLAWDHDADELYLTGGLFSTGSNTGYMVKVDTTTGKGTKVTQKDGGYGASAASLMFAAVYGLYIVPSGSAGIVQMVDEASAIELDKTRIDGLVGMETAIAAYVTNWNVRDKSVTWTTSDASVATVTTAGRVKLVGVGEATITATTNAAPNLSATCTVKVTETPEVDLSAMLLDEDANAHWVEFNTAEPQNYEIIADAEKLYYSGDVLDGVIYVHDGSTMYGVDADTFETTTYSGVSSSYRWSDAAAAPAIGGTFDYMVCLSNSGALLAQIDVTTGIVEDSWNMTDYLGSDRMAAIAWAGTGKHDYSYPDYVNLDCHYYYMITEAGDLWKLTLCTYEHFQFGERSLLTREKLGNIGVDLDGVSGVVNGKYASMVYDQESGYLFLSAYTSGDTNKLYAVHPDSMLAKEIGDFGQEIWPVVSLYQFDRATDLTLRMKTKEATIYEGNSVKLVCDVVMAEKDSGLTWTSSNNSIATVDANGKVTGVSAGTVTITATTVETNDNGEKISATATVTVLANKPMDLTVGAQIVTEDGSAKWVTIDTATGTYTVDGNANTAFNAAAGHDGKLVGTTASYAADGKLFTVNAETFAETVGGNMESETGIRDMTTAPVDVMDIADYWTFEHYDGEAFGMPLALLEGEKLALIEDMATGEMMPWGLSIWEVENVGALTYIGHTWYDTGYHEGVCEAKVFYSVASDGRLREFIIRPTWIDYAYDDSKDYALSNYTIGHLGVTFDDPYGMTMTYIYDGTNNGLLLGDTTDNKVDLYWIDLTNDNYTAVKICTLEGAVAISGLYTEDDLKGTKHHSDLPTNMDNSVIGAPHHGMTTDVLIGEVSALTGKVIGSETETTGSRTVMPSSTERRDDCIAGNTTVSLMSDLDTTNGLITVEFDADLVSLESITTYTSFKSIKEEAGKITFGYVNDGAMSRDSVLADLVFQLKEGKEADVTITVVEDNAFAIGSKEIVTLTAPQHSYELDEVVEPTCTEDGYEVYVCSGCGDSYTVTLEALGHDYEAVVTEPTCTEDGYTTYTCTVCGESYVDDVVEAYCPSAKFEDISLTAWYHEAVDYVVENELMNGMSDTTFAPENKTTRAQLVTVLYRLAGSPETELTEQFKDVSKDAWYAEAVAWAYANEITEGITADLFAPEANVTREQVVTFLARFAERNGIDTETEGDLSEYTDAAQVSEYAVSAMIWAIDNGIINGMGDGTLAPKADSTRAQIATILMRFIEG